MAEDLERAKQDRRAEKDLREIEAMADRLIARILALGCARPILLAAECVKEAKSWLRRYPPE